MRGFLKIVLGVQKNRLNEMGAPKTHFLAERKQNIIYSHTANWGPADYFQFQKTSINVRKMRPLNLSDLLFLQ